MLKILSEKHSLYEFLSTLSIKCSYLLFSKEYVKEILAEVSARKSSNNILGIQPCMDFLAVKIDLTHHLRFTNFLSINLFWLLFYFFKVLAFIIAEYIHAHEHIFFYLLQTPPG